MNVSNNPNQTNLSQTRERVGLKKGRLYELYKSRGIIFVLIGAFMSFILLQVPLFEPYQSNFAINFSILFITIKGLYLCIVEPNEMED